VSLQKNLIKYTALAAVLLIFFFQAAPYLKKIKYENFPDTYYSTNESTTNVKNEYLPKWARLSNLEKRAETPFLVEWG